MSIKEQVMERVKDLPDTATIADIQEELEILASLEEGLTDIREGRTHTVEEAQQMLGFR